MLALNENPNYPISSPPSSILDSFKLDNIDPLTNQTFRVLFNRAREENFPSYAVAAVKYKVTREGESKWKFLDGVLFFLDSYKENPSENIKKVHFFALRCFEFNNTGLELVDEPAPSLFPDILLIDPKLRCVLIAALDIENTSFNGIPQFLIAHQLSINNNNQPFSKEEAMREAIRWFHCSASRNVEGASIEMESTVQELKNLTSNK